MKGSNYPYIALAKQFLANRKFFAYFALALLLFLATPTPSHALGISLTDLAEGAAAGLASGILGTIMWILNLVGILIFTLSLVILTASMDFVLSVPYTPIHDTPVAGVVAGWTIIRDFANMFFILILIAIGVGTMLSIDVRGKKLGPDLLIPFAIIAVLINFTPLLTGIVIDISNIFTKFFFDYAVGGVGALQEANPFRAHINPFDGLTTDPGQAGAYIFKLIVALIFNLSASFVLFTISILLIVRVLALWLLVIFSPLAFAAYILPQTRSYFEKWWGQFLQWAILPIPIGLFLFLASAILDNGGISGACSEISSPEAQQALQGISFCDSITAVMALGIMVAGMIVGISSSAKGSGFIVNRATKTRQDAVKWANRRRLQSQQAVGRAAVRTAREGFSYKVPLGTRRQVPGLKSLPDKLTRKADTPVIGGMMGAAGAGMQKWLNGTTKKELDAEENRYKGLSSDQLKEHLKYERNPRRVAILSKLLAKDDNDGFSEVVGGNKDLKNLIEQLQYFAKSNIELAKIFKDVSKKNPHLIPNADKGKVVAGMSPKDIGALSTESWKDAGVMSGLLNNNKLTQPVIKGVARNPKKALAFRDGMLDFLIKEKILTPKSPMPSAEELERILPKFLNPADAQLFSDALKGNPVMQVALHTARKETDDEQKERLLEDAKDAARDTAKESNDAAKEPGTPS